MKPKQRRFRGWAVFYPMGNPDHWPWVIYSTRGEAIRMCDLSSKAFGTKGDKVKRVTIVVEE